MTTITRRMTVVRAPSSNGKAMIRLINNLLPKTGFEIGTPIEVSYEQGEITITKLEKTHHGDNL